MAAGDSIVNICNIGLIAIGQDPINTLADRTKRAILCSLRYDQIRREVLRSHNWNCAKKRALLNASSTPPAFGYGVAYDLPADFLRFYTEDEDQAFPKPDWVIENGQVLSNDDGPLEIIYIFDLQDCTKFDALLVAALGEAIGAALAKPLTQDAGEEAAALARAEGKVAAARTASSQENSPSELNVDVMLIARG